MYFSEMSFYSYYLKKSLENVLNVGWLSEAGNFPKGEVSRGFIEKLGELLISNHPADYKINRIRGVHPCNICKKRDFDNFHIGSCEILIPRNKEGFFFASPSMILHYVEEHGYAPPEDYIKAVMEVDMNVDFPAQKVFDSMIG